MCVELLRRWESRWKKSFSRTEEEEEEGGTEIPPTLFIALVMGAWRVAAGS